MALWIIVAILAIVFWRQLYYVLAVPVCVCVALLPTVFAGLMTLDATETYRLTWLHIACVVYFGLSLLVIGWIFWQYVSVMWFTPAPPQHVQNSIKRMEGITKTK
ncbi:hypothetical protein [Rhizobium sp. 2MFCol3.1]|uniref:hypothetical protein n=1 Tax=Rhizobium sp. 2MFCol3.1 TaxID=1246459 RepID=UPI00036EDEC2|nr:hypothetical protein [Rhizobium sp. 2MFCol3.1]